MKKVTVLLLALFVGISTICEAQKKFSYDNIASGTFRSRSVSGIRSMIDGEHYTTMSGGNIVKYSYASGAAVDTIFSAAKNGALKFSSYEFSPNQSKLLLTTNVKSIYRHSFSADYWIYDIASSKLTQLTPDGKEQVASFSPDGSKVAFVRGNNLYYVNLADNKLTQITTDGKFNYILNGIPDWVYEEEYSFSKAYEWSPASDYIAFMRTDEERVKEYNMNMFDNNLYPSVYKFKYPKAGEENSIVTILTYRLSDGTTTPMEIGNPNNQYIPRIMWSPQNQLAIARLNRNQNHFDLLLANPQTGQTSVIYNETNPRYVERIDNQTITFLPDGDRFLVKNESSGNMHLYLYSIKKGKLNAITSGNWDITDLLGVDTQADRVYYLSAETSPLKRNLYSVKLNGKEKKRITSGEGTYRIDFSNGHKYFISHFSNATTPNTVTLHSLDGKLLRTLEDNKELKAKIAEYKVPTKEFFSFTTSEGVKLYGYMIKPNGFDVTKKYPLFMTQYSGPGSQSAADSWSLGWEQALVQDGYVVACVDGRGTGFRGEEFKKCTYKDLGNLEVKDQIEAARYLGSMEFIDPSRIGIYGWSYGGFMALNCIFKGNDVFKTSIAVAPVTSWRYYDTIYTELYNGLPQANPSGYDNNSPLNFTHLLKGKLLLAHGTGDDNVHIQNSYELISALSKNNKPFDLSIYPDRNHGMGQDRDHLMRKCIEFTKANL